MREAEQLRPGLYEDLTTEQLERALASIQTDLIERRLLDPGDADVVIARYVGQLVRRALAASRGADAAAIERQVALANRLIVTLRELAPEAFVGLEEVSPSHDILMALLEPPSTPGPPRAPERPDTPLSASALLVNGRDQAAHRR